MSSVPFEQRAHRVIMYDDCVFPLTNSGAVAEVTFVDPEEGPAGLVAYTLCAPCAIARSRPSHAREQYKRAAPRATPCAHKQLLQIFHNPDISRVRREAAWESLKPDVGGPRDALLEWGPGQALGSIAFGSRPRGAMAQWINKKRDASR